MAKDPAFLFYPGDWIVGCQTLSMAERGQYITLLAMMHQQGPMDEETIRLLVGSVSVRLMSKFYKNEDGFFFQERLEKEINARKSFVESRRINGAKGGRPKDYESKKNKKPIGKPKGNLMEDVNEIENEIEVNKKRSEKQNLNFGALQDSFSEKWEQWIRFKKEQHKQTYKSKESEQVAVKHLIKISGGDCMVAEQIIDQSIGNLWVGLFELKKETKNNGKATTTATPEKRFGRISEGVLTEFVNRGPIAPVSGEGGY